MSYSVPRSNPILSFFLAYRNSQLLPGGGKNQKICDFDNLPKNDQVCALQIEDFKNCSSQNRYSYDKSSPCIFLKLNRVSRIQIL